jgi:catechol 2,3-dioxygenase-like lactoylglutathione lyase family enzyme
MITPTTPVLGTRRVCQIAVVVRDIDRAARHWSAFLGMPLPPIITTESGDKVGQTYRGEPSNARCKLAFFAIDNTVIEIIEPLGGSSSWQAVLDEKGEGVHHIAFTITDTAGKVQSLAAQGIPVLHQGGNPATGQFTYLDSRDKLGVIVELLEGYK